MPIPNGQPIPMHKLHYILKKKHLFTSRKHQKREEMHQSQLSNNKSKNGRKVLPVKLPNIGYFCCKKKAKQENRRHLCRSVTLSPQKKSTAPVHNLTNTNLTQQMLQVIRSLQ